MPNAATLNRAASPSARSNDPVIAVPFTRAAYEHEEQFNDASQALDANQHEAQVDVPAYGYMRSIYLLVEAASGTGTATVAVNEDAPWAVLASVSLSDVNGAPIVGPFTGYDLYLANKYGGYRGHNDPRQLADFTAVATGANGTGNFSFGLRLPVEISRRDALGSLANQNASSTYKLRYTLSAASSVYSTAPTTPPTVRVRCFLEAYSQPPAADLRNNPQATAPPAHGTVQYWSKFVSAVASGANTVRLPRTGNMLRNLIFVLRATSDGTRATGAGLITDPWSIYWDSALMHSLTVKKWKRNMIERYGYDQAAETVRGLDNGVFVYDFIHDFDGRAGHEMRDGWLPTVQSTRLEVAGTASGAASLSVLTNDVAPAGNVFID